METLVAVFGRVSHVGSQWLELVVKSAEVLGAVQESLDLSSITPDPPIAVSVIHQLLL